MTRPARPRTGARTDRAVRNQWTTLGMRAWIARAPAAPPSQAVGGVDRRAPRPTGLPTGRPGRRQRPRAVAHSIHRPYGYGGECCM
jgi:hypothetical protein